MPKSIIAGKGQYRRLAMVLSEISVGQPVSFTLIYHVIGCNVSNHVQILNAAFQYCSEIGICFELAGKYGYRRVK